MAKTFIYRDYDAEYEVSGDELREALSNIVFDLYFNSAKVDRKQVKRSLKDFILNADIEEDLTEKYEDSLKEYFEDKVKRMIGLYD